MRLEALRLPAMPGWDALPTVWRRPLGTLAVTWAGLIAAFAGDWLAMFDQWWNSSTYNHVLLVIPIIGWLAWQRWPQVSTLEPRPWRWGLARWHCFRRPCWPTTGL